jgi:hypothetical protein
MKRKGEVYETNMRRMFYEYQRQFFDFRATTNLAILNFISHTNVNPPTATG